jgi:ABC-type dipeptide/oligopeptide/nickel transport system ATPase component
VDSLLHIDGLCVDFATARGWARVVSDVSLAVPRGRTVGLVGESGSGKSVTCQSILRLIPEPPGRISGGRILFEGRDVLASLIYGFRISVLFGLRMTLVS